MSKSSAKQSADYTQTTTQVDKRIGASDSAVVLQGGGTAVGSGGTNIQSGGNLTIESLDADVIAESLGLSRDVAEQIANFAIQTSADSTAVSREALERGFEFGGEALDFGRDIAYGANDTVQQALDALAKSNTETLLFSDKSQAQLAQGFENFGTELSKVKAIEVSQGATISADSQRNLVIAGTVLLVIGGGLYFYNKRN